MTFCMTDELKEKFQVLAIERTSPFCYGCYKVVGNVGDDSGLCTGCGSDDLMRHLDGVGVEYGSEWVIEHLIDDELESINQDDIYDDMLDDCYEAVKIGTLEYSVSHVLKCVDEVAYDMGKHEYFDSLVEDGVYIELNGEYYVPDIE